ncbi:hydrogenase small subunit [Methanosarcina sp. KYL-1]|uniref:hydrogenase small subunit n=1 Tax=Methanosarcina sp. KYL-1 TaxID=2602068 RepID=UPI002100DE82|nr:hydrogenase small subunit [Methanosarcina sp. KYL-1]MCQ1535000.1 hydrogenase small subunit [Methanosarcina sp. KYL-1]
MGEDGYLDRLKHLDFMKMNRRAFLKAVGALGASLFLQTYRSEIVRALEFSETRIVWVHGGECTGCSESLLNGGEPDLLQALKRLNMRLAYHEVLLGPQGIYVDGKMANTSELNSEILFEEVIEEKGYILVAEGAIPNGPRGTGKYCILGGKTYKDIFRRAAENAAFIVAVGQCATNGGVNSADSEIRDLMDFRGVAFTMEDREKGILREYGLEKPVININGCPPHADWMLLTLAAVVLGKIKVPDDLPYVLDELLRPKVFFPPDHVIHDNCPRRGYYDKGEFDTVVSGPKCLWKLGCKAPYTHADCAIRRWNGYHSLCPQSGSPCIACVSPGFPDSSRPFFQEIEDVGIVGTNIDTVAKVAIGGALLAAGAHAVRRIAVKDKPERKEEKEEKGKESAEKGGEDE